MNTSTFRNNTIHFHLNKPGSLGHWLSPDSSGHEEDGHILNTWTHRFRPSAALLPVMAHLTGDEKWNHLGPINYSCGAELRFTSTKAKWSRLSAARSVNQTATDQMLLQSKSYADEASTNSILGSKEQNCILKELFDVMGNKFIQDD